MGIRMTVCVAMPNKIKSGNRIPKTSPLRLRNLEKIMRETKNKIAATPAHKFNLKSEDIVCTTNLRLYRYIYHLNYCPVPYS